MKLHSDPNYAKLEMCVQALEIGNAISFALTGGPKMQHKVFANEQKMQVTLVYSMPDMTDSNFAEFLKNYRDDLPKLYSSFQESKEELRREGVEIVTNIFSIESSGIPA